MNNQANLLVVSGPSGIGKDTVVQCLIDAHRGEAELSVSATTRPPRGYEKQGVHYTFLPVGEFKRLIAEGLLVEYTLYAGNYYGTPKCEVDRRINSGIACVLVIEVNGAANVKRVYPGCTTVFIEAPNMREHERRLRLRGSESEEDMAERMRIAEDEMQMAGGYDFRLVNDEAGRCAEELYRILKKRQAGECP